MSALVVALVPGVRWHSQKPAAREAYPVNPRLSGRLGKPLGRRQVEQDSFPADCPQSDTRLILHTLFFLRHQRNGFDAEIGPGRMRSNRDICAIRTRLERDQNATRRRAGRNREAIKTQPGLPSAWVEHGPNPRLVALHSLHKSGNPPSQKQQPESSGFEAGRRVLASALRLRCRAWGYMTFAQWGSDT